MSTTTNATLRAGRSNATVRVVRQEPCARFAWEGNQQLCLLETVWNKQGGPRYAVAVNARKHWMAYWGEGGDVIRGYRWNGMNMRRFLRWMPREEADAEFQRALLELREGE